MIATFISSRATSSTTTTSKEVVCLVIYAPIYYFIIKHHLYETSSFSLLVYVCNDKKIMFSFSCTFERCYLQKATKTVQNVYFYALVNILEAPSCRFCLEMLIFLQLLWRIEGKKLVLRLMCGERWVRVIVGSGDGLKRFLVETPCGCYYTHNPK